MNKIIIGLGVLLLSFSGCTSESSIAELEILPQPTLYQVSSSPQPLEISWKSEGEFLQVTMTHGSHMGQFLVDSEGRTIEQRSQRESYGWTLTQYTHGPQAFAPEPLLFAPGEIQLSSEMLSELNLFGFAIMSPSSGLQTIQEGNRTRVSFECLEQCAVYNGEVVHGDFLLEEGNFFPKQVIYPHEELTLTLIEEAIPDLTEVSRFAGWQEMEASCDGFCSSNPIHPALNLSLAKDSLEAVDPLKETAKFGFLTAAKGDPLGAWFFAYESQTGERFTRQAYLAIEDDQVVPIHLPPAANSQQEYFGTIETRVPFDAPWNAMNLNGTLLAITSIQVSFQDKFPEPPTLRYQFEDEGLIKRLEVSETNGLPRILVIIPP